MTEVWRIISGFSNYKISSMGRVKSRLGILKPFRFKKTEPYLAIDLMLCGIKYRRAVHQLVLEAFVGPRPSPKHDSRHKNGIGDDNKLTNLCWSTKKKNQGDRVKHDTHCRGERHYHSKLTKRDVRNIRVRRKLGEKTTSTDSLIGRFGNG